jgi:hypothetical protein
MSGVDRTSCRFYRKTLRFRTGSKPGNAWGEPKPRSVGHGKSGYWFITTVLRARINGDYRRTPFFRMDTGAPLVSPRVLSNAEFATVMDAVRNYA